LSDNNLHGSIPYQLPPNLTYLYVFLPSIICSIVNSLVSVVLM
jgi:hypothetical protein